MFCVSSLAHRVLFLARRSWYRSTLMVRPRAEVVHRVRSGQPLHHLEKGALPPGRMRVVCPAGQVTVRAPVSIPKSSRW